MPPQPPNLEVILWIGGIAIGIIGGLLTVLWKIVDKRHEDHDRKIDDLIKLSSELKATLKTWIALSGSKAAKMLHSPHTADLDKILDKIHGFGISSLTAAELSWVIEELERMENDARETLPRRELAGRLLLNLCAIHSLREFSTIGPMSPTLARPA